MPKTRKKFDWEIRENGQFIDILTMTRSEMAEYRQQFPQYEIREISYTDGGDDTL